MITEKDLYVGQHREVYHRAADIVRKNGTQHPPRHRKGRPSTPDQVIRPQLTRGTIKRRCDGCGVEIGDANPVELAAVCEGQPLPSVIDEHGCRATPEQMRDFINGCN